ncbi:hypothetical protein DWW52_14305 [Odoribacter sp. AF15-53]|nr:hypothetical protein DWW52_14305 [Odoribacter sp. AF15-53]
MNARGMQDECLMMIMNSLSDINKIIIKTGFSPAEYKLCSIASGKITLPFSLKRRCKKRGYLKSLFPIKSLPPPAPPYTGGGVITKRVPLLCKEGLGVVVLRKLTFQTASFLYLNR